MVLVTETTAGFRARTPTLPPIARSRGAVVGIAAGPALIAAAGLTHPPGLSPESAGHWVTLHIVLIPMFPLVGLNLIWLMAGVRGLLPLLVRLAGFTHAVFYPAVDLLAGVGAGRLVQIGQDPYAPTVSALFTRGNELAAVGVAALWVGALLTLGVLWPTLRYRAVVWGVPLLVGAYLFGEHHIYRPWGAAGMALLALGFAGLLRSRQITGP